MRRALLTSLLALVVLLPPSHGAPLFAYGVVANTIAGGTSGDTSNVTTSAIDTTGANLLIACVAYISGTASVTDSKSNTWSALTAINSSVDVRAFYVSAPTVGSGHTVTGSAAVGFPSVSLVALSGAKVSTPFDVENGAGAGGTSVATGNVTPSENNEIVLTCLSTGGSTITGVSGGAGFTILDTVNFLTGNHLGLSHAYQIQTTAATVSATWTTAGVANKSATAATFKAEPVVGGTLPIPFVIGGRGRR